METPARGKNGKYRRADPAATAEQDARACDMYSRGYTYREISAELGWESAGTAHKAVARAYKAIVAPSVEQARKRSLERLDRAHRVAAKIMEAEHITVSQGRVVCDADGVPVPDDAPKLQAIDRIVRIEQRMADVIGFDAPKRSSVDVFNRDAFATELEAMAEELESNDRAGEETPAGA